MSSKNKSRVNFSYAFGTPHRLTVAMPDSSHKTLLDVQNNSLRMCWSYDDLTKSPLGAYTPLRANKRILIRPEIDGKEFSNSRWKRMEDYLPALENIYNDDKCQLKIEIIGGAKAAIGRLEMISKSDKPISVGICFEASTGEYPYWVNNSFDRDVLQARYYARADRILIFVPGADEYKNINLNTLYPVWELKPGETHTDWLIRPYEAYLDDLKVLRKENWTREFESAKQVWRDLISRSVKVDIPDTGVKNAFYACLSDLFIMREPVADGYIAGTAGTELYRASEPGEPVLVAIALDQVGLHTESAKGLKIYIDLQEPDGNWTEPKGWSHYMWGLVGFKTWAVIEHYLLTGDKKYLSKIYPKLVASSRWQEKQRSRTRQMENGQKPLTYGLMPRGMGDCGLKDDDDFCGVFFPHNVWSVYADYISVEAAKILGKKKNLPELTKIYRTALDDLRQALDRGAITEKDYRWIPGVPGKTSGSRWGALNAAFPCRILPPAHELITGTIRKLESQLSPGGLPVNLGWMKDGMWVAITLDNLAETLLMRNDGDSAVKYIYAVLNHGTPLYTWCEERGQEPGSATTHGDRQHLWTPVAVVRILRDCLVMEDNDTLHLARGVDRDWFTTEEPVGIYDAPTHFGKISFRIKYSAKTQKIEGWISNKGSKAIKNMILHLRLPGNLKPVSVDSAVNPEIATNGTQLIWNNFLNEVHFSVKVK